MKNIIVLLFIIIITTAYSPIDEVSVKNLTTKEFKELIWNFEQEKDWKYKGDKPVIIELYATWCAPCKKLSPILEEIQQEYGDKLQVYKVDVDSEIALARLFKVNSIPLMIFIPKEGPPFTVVGLHSKENLIGIITDKLGVKK